MTKLKNSVGIHFQLDKFTNSELKIAAAVNGRTKRQEAAIRLHDHVLRFKSVPSGYEKK